MSSTNGREYGQSNHKMTRSEKAAMKASKAKAGKRILIICSIVLTAALLLGLSGFFVYNYWMENRPIEANITVAGVSVQGMSPKEAASAISEAFALSHRGKQMVIKVGSETITLTADETNVHLDTDALTKVAQGLPSNTPEQELSLVEYLQIDRQKVLPIIEEVTGNLESSLVENSYEVIGTAPEKFDVVDETVSQKLIIRVGTPGISIDPEGIITAIINAYAEGNFAFEFVFPIEKPEPLNLEEIFNAHCFAPVNAYVNEENTKKFEIIKEILGYGFDPVAVAEALDQAEAGSQLEFDFMWTKPEVTEESLHQQIFCDVLGDMSTTAGWSATRNTNLRLGCEAINGTILMPGETFSFNKLVGATTKDKGYDTGHGYLEGEVAEVIGGGICQVASTLYVACVEADLQIVERYMHAYMPSYMGASTDATIYYPYLDYKFKNNTDRPIKVEAIASGATVTCKILSVDTRDYYVKFETVIVKNIPWKTIYKEYPPDNEEGYTDGQVLSKSSPYSSVESKSFRNKYSKETNKLISSKLENHETYDVRDKVVVKIVDPNAPTEPPETEPPTSENPGTEPPVTEPPASENPGTEPPVTEPPVTEPPSSEGDTPPSGGNGGITEDG